MCRMICCSAWLAVMSLFPRSFLLIFAFIYVWFLCYDFFLHYHYYYFFLTLFVVVFLILFSVARNVQDEKKKSGSIDAKQAPFFDDVKPFFLTASQAVI